MKHTTSVGDDFPREQARIRVAIGIYQSLPQGAGAFGALMMEELLRRADRAAAGGDLAEIVRVYHEMKSTAPDIGLNDGEG